MKIGDRVRIVQARTMGGKTYDITIIKVLNSKGKVEGHVLTGPLAGVKMIGNVVKTLAEDIIALKEALPVLFWVGTKDEEYSLDAFETAKEAGKDIGGWLANRENGEVKEPLEIGYKGIEVLIDDYFERENPILIFKANEDDYENDKKRKPLSSSEFKVFEKAFIWAAT